MANRKGSVLIFGLLVMAFLAIISAGYFYSNISESFMTRRLVDSTRAFWAAEAALAEGIRNLPATTSGTFSDPSLSYRSATQFLGNHYYQVNAVGSYAYPNGSTINRRINGVVKTIVLDPSKFPYAIETTVKLVIKGSVDITPLDSSKQYSVINFADRFLMSKEDVKAYATVYNAIPAAMSGVVWLEPPAGSSPTFSWNLDSNLVGHGILIVQGDIHIAGTINWDGIIYVMGKLRMSGTPVCSGAVLAESGITVDDTTMTGNVTLNYDYQKISDALNLLSYASAQLVSWKEIQ